MNETTENALHTRAAETVTDPLALVGDTPDILTLHAEYTRAWTQTQQSQSGKLSGLVGLAAAEDVRYCRWPGQTPDGLKHQNVLPEGKRAMPYDCAPDTRIPFADETINAITDVLVAAFWGARINPKPTHTTRLTMQQVAEWRAVIAWMIHGPLKSRLIKQVDYLAQMAHTFGHAWLHPTWKLRYGLKQMTLNRDELVQQAAASPQDSIARQLVTILLDPTLEDQAVEVFQQYYPTVSKANARAAVKELREEGDCEFTIAEQQENAPQLDVLLSWVDLITPCETTDIQTARMATVRRFLTEAQIEEMANESLPDEVRWRRDFCDAVKATRGLVSDGSNTQQTNRDENRQLIEIAVTHHKGIDPETGATAIYCTVWSPHLQTGNRSDTMLYGQHYLLDYAHCQYPLIEYGTEVIGKRADDARGVPEVLQTIQTEVKRQYDGLAIFTELSLTPPLAAPLGMGKLPPEFGPLALMRTNPGQGQWTPIRLTEGADPGVAFKLIEDKKKWRDEYFGLARPDTHPARATARMQRLVNRWLLAWGETLWQLSVLTYQNTPPAELAAIIGRNPLLTADDLMKHRLNLTFDVRGMDNEWVKEMVSQVGNILQTDTGGMVDRSKLTGVLLAYLDPTLAEEVTTDQQGAANAIYEKVRNDVVAIMAGNQPMLVQNDPTAQMKLKFAMEIVQGNPEYMAQLIEAHPQTGQPNPNFNPGKAKAFETFIANLKHSYQETVLSKQQGRLGVSDIGSAPVGMGAGIGGQQ